MEILHTINSVTIPSHILCLKDGAPMIFLCNLSSPKLYKGTRLQVKILQKLIMIIMIFTDVNQGKTVFRHKFCWFQQTSTFRENISNFPIKVCFEMPMSLKVAGVILGLTVLPLGSCTWFALESVHSRA